MASATFMDLDPDIRHQIFRSLVPEVMTIRRHLVAVDNERGRFEEGDENVIFAVRKDPNYFSVNPRLPLLLINKIINSEMAQVSPPAKVILKIGGAPQNQVMWVPQHELREWFRNAPLEQKKALRIVQYTCNSRSIITYRGNRGPEQAMDQHQTMTSNAREWILKQYFLNVALIKENFLYSSAGSRSIFVTGYLVFRVSGYQG
jgi:hypothetical protein